MKLLLNEHKIISSNNELIILTNIRIIQTNKTIGNSDAGFIFLEDISSIQSMYKSNTKALGLVCVFAVLGLMAVARNSDEMGYAVLCFSVGIICFLYWWFSRMHIVSVYPNGGKCIEFQVAGMSAEQVNDFIDAVQDAKANRVNELYRIHTGGSIL